LEGSSIYSTKIEIKMGFLIKMVGLIAVVSAFAQSDSNASQKCLPLQWEASVVGSMMIDLLGVAVSTPVTMETATDYKNKKETFHQHLHYSSSNIVDVNYYRDFDQMIEYLEIPMLKLCSKTKISTDSPPFIQLCNDSATLTHSESLMLGKRMIDTYASALYGETISMSMFRDDFEMVSATIRQKWEGNSQIVFMQYGNITDGIKDPEVFNVPSHCLHSQVEQENLQAILSFFLSKTLHKP